MAVTSNAQLVVGRGELYFNRFAPGTKIGDGELYLGNTPGFALARDTEELARFTSYGGQRVEQSPLVLREMHTASIVTDNINMDNLSMWFSGDVETVNQADESAISETIVVTKGRFYQLGMTVRPDGVRYVRDDITFVRNGSPVTLTNNIFLDRESGRFQVLETSSIPNGSSLLVTFRWRPALTRVLTPTPNLVEGSLRFISKNVTGLAKDVFFPNVQITPEGEFDLKSDQWQQFSFRLSVKKHTPAAEFFYITELNGPIYSDDELAIIDDGKIPLDIFPFYEDLLHAIVNENLPRTFATT